jgi:hypothetical protein
MTLRRRLLSLVAAATALGCGGVHDKPPPPPPPATVTIGATALDGSGFQPMGGDQTLVAGAQGGFHVWLKYRVAGMSPGTVRVHREVHRVSDQALILLTDGTQDVGAASPAGYWELPAALPSFMCPTPIGISVIDERVHFDLTLTADDGSTLGHGSAEATVHCPAGDEAPFCARICSG